jgi:hypothetical protein
LLAVLLCALCVLRGENECQNYQKSKQCGGAY